MEALILAAGLGTRLRPLTNRIPKALVPVADIPMLERVARRLVDAGATRLVINIHHHASLIEEFVAEKKGFGVEVNFSRETGDAPLETGGGILQASEFLSLQEPFVVHNVDVITDLDIRALYEAHQPDAVATLATVDAETRSPLLVDDHGMCGVRFPSGTRRMARDPVGAVREHAFSGISVISPTLPGLMTERGAFSVMDVYLRLIAEDHRVAAWKSTDTFWIDIGTHDRLETAARHFG